MVAFIHTYATESDYENETESKVEKFDTATKAMIEAKKRISKARKEGRPMGIKIFDPFGKVKFKMPYFN